MRHGVRADAGEIRGQVVRMTSSVWDFRDRPLFAALSGGSAMPSTPSTAAASVQIVLSKDGTAGLAFLGVAGRTGAPILQLALLILLPHLVSLAVPWRCAQVMS